MRIAIVILLTAFWVSAGAEELHDVSALDTLGEIKAKYPNAVFKAVKAAWVKEDEAFFSMEGPGFPGKLFIAFEDTRPSWRKFFDNRRVSSAEALSPEMLELEKSVAYGSDDKALTVSWVRWVPTSPIPFARYKSRYGEPTSCDYAKSDMTPFCTWKPRQLMVSLSDDKLLVTQVEAQFTKSELRAAYVRKGIPLPEELANASQEPSASQPQRKSNNKPVSAPDAKGKPQKYSL